MPWGDVGDWVGDIFSDIQWYSSMNQAALAWAKAYGEQRITKNQEFSSNIYEKNGGKKFTFTNPPRLASKGDRAHQSPGPKEIAANDKLSKKYKLRGHIHSHGGYDAETDLDFSIWKPGYPIGDYDDKLIEKNDNLSFYLFTPNGEIRASKYVQDPYTFDVSRKTVYIARGLYYDKGPKLAKRNAKYPLLKRPSKIELTEHFEY